MNLDLFSNAEAIVRLTPLQHAMLAHTKLRGGGAYIGQMSVRLRGKLDPDRIGAAFQQLVDRHAALRTLFTTEGVEEPLQIVLPVTPITVLTTDLVGRSDAQIYLNEFLSTDRVTPFALDHPPLMRVALFRLDAELWHLVLTRHHLIMDGWSANLLLEELDALLAGERLLGPVKPFHHFVDWLDRRDNAAANAFWAESLKAASEGTWLLPGERLMRGETPAALREIIRPLEGALVTRLHATARASGLTTQTFFTGAWATLAARYAGANVAQFGLTVAGRPEELPDVAGSVGLFMDTVPICIAVDNTEPVDRWLKGIQQTLADTARHPHLGIPALKRIAGLQGDETLFSHILVLEAYKTQSGRRASWSIEEYRFIDQTNFALNVGVVQDDGVHLAAVFDPTRLAPTVIERLLANFETAIEAMLCAGAAPLGTIDIVSASERLALERMSGCQYPPLTETGDDLPHRLAVAVADHGPRTAVICGRDALTYDHLWQHAGQIAAHLRRRGIECDQLVGLALPRSIAQVVAMLGVLRAGGAFVPLDPDDPPARRAAMVADADLKVVIGPEDLDAMMMQPADPPPLASLPRNAAAYALFTSGSTGRAKLALNGQEAIVNRLAWMQKAFPIGQDDRVLQKTASTFDVSVWEFLWPLLEGACLVLAAPNAHRDSEAIREAVGKDGITVLHLVPSVLRLILAIGGLETWTSLRHLIMSGESVDSDLPLLLRRALPMAQVHNLYGPAEAAIDVTVQELDELATGETVPIGRPIDGVSIRLLDGASRPVPWGAIGEIAIGGIAVGRGYVGRPDLTADRFAPDPLAGPGQRLYRTGDLARWDEAGRLLFHGRADYEIKLRGQRIDLGEIETALRASPGITDAVVLVAGKGTPDASLVAHLVGGAPNEPSEALIERTRKSLRDTLPAALVPAQWHRHEALPRLASQKIDRTALSALAGPLRSPPVAPRNDEERQLANLWSQVLGRSDVGVTTDFFELGGHSLLLVRLGNLIQRDFGVTLELAELFDATTVERQLTLVLDRWLAAADSGVAARMLAEIVEGG
jgi:amino acid adenylation domain-containing protein